MPNFSWCHAVRRAPCGCVFHKVRTPAASRITTRPQAKKGRNCPNVKLHHSNRVRTSRLTKEIPTKFPKRALSHYRKEPSSTRNLTNLYKDIKNLSENKPETSFSHGLSFASQAKTDRPYIYKKGRNFFKLRPWRNPRQMPPQPPETTSKGRGDISRRRSSSRWRPSAPVCPPCR